MNVLDLFSGIGGFSLGLERAGMRTVAFCESDEFCQQVLRKHWPGVPIFHDIQNLCAVGHQSLPGVAGIDVICGGFPCQDLSAAGNRAGIDGERSGLWRDFARLIGELRPRYAIVENVAALTFWGLERVLGDLAALGFDAEWHCIPATYVGAHHIRDRIWIIAYPPRQRMDGGEPDAPLRISAALSLLADSFPKGDWRSAYGQHGRTDHGLPHRSHRGHALGNAVVPQIPEIIGRAIMQYEREHVAA